MRFSIDIVFVARDGTVLRIAEHVPPWRFRAVRRTRFVLELAAGEATVLGLTPGTRLRLEDALASQGPRRSRLRQGRSVALAAIVCALSVARFDSPLATVEAAFFGCVLVVLADIDLERHVLPNRIVVPAVVVLAGVELAGDPGVASRRLLWATGAFLVLLVLALVYPPGLGMGDVKLAFLLGLGLGASVVGAFLLGTFAAAVFGAGLLIRHGAAGRRLSIPLGSFLAIGSLILLFTQGPR
jgi:leader peptidase (prepilin peptidase)/N-methyltransferase